VKLQGTTDRDEIGIREQALHPLARPWCRPTADLEVVAKDFARRGSRVAVNWLPRP
jgi:hypothetical protein